MHWKVKAAVQKTMNILPGEISREGYYFAQRRFGSLRRFNPEKHLSAAVSTWNHIKKLGYDPSGKVFFEVGTGRIPLFPVTYWLLGAGKIITLDLNKYLKPELLMESVRYIANNKNTVQGLLGPGIKNNRMRALLDFAGKAPFKPGPFLKTCRIEYTAPADAAETGLPESSVDFHTSYTVFEHIPEEEIKKILEEGNRITRNSGVFAHTIDYSDHFAVSDKNISSINFLRFSERKWRIYAGNRYMYMNRLRHDDYIRLFESAGHRILDAETAANPSLFEILERGELRLDEAFRKKKKDIIAITGARLISRKGD